MGIVPIYAYILIFLLYLENTLYVLWYNLGMNYYERIEDIKLQLEQKQNIYLSINTFNDLLKDMRDFEVFDNKGEINKSDFINRLICNYSKEYIDEITKLADSTKTELEKIIKDDSIDFKEIATRTVMTVLSKDTDKSVKHNKILSFRVKKKYLATIASVICRVPYEMDLSSFLRNMILSYLSLPIYKREQVIYKEEIEKLNYAIENGIDISIDYRTGNGIKTHIVSPYSIDRSAYELRNYLIVESHKKETPYIMSLKIFRISNIILLDLQKSHFADDFKTKYKAMKRNGIAYPINEISIKKVKMDETALSIFNAKYLERPALIKYEDGVAFFDCSESQLNFYFNPFGDSVNILGV